MNEQPIPEKVEEAVREHKRKRRWRAFWLIVVWLCIGSFAGFCIFLVLTIMDLRPPNEVLQTFDANTITYRDGRLQFYYLVKRSETCRNWTNRWLWTYVTYNGKKIKLQMPLDSTSATTLGSGTDTYLLSLPLPTGIWDGQWYYESTAVSQCGLFGFLHPVWTTTGNIPVTIRGTTNEPPPDLNPLPRPPKWQPPPKDVVHRRMSPPRHIIVRGGGAPFSAEILP